MTTTPIDEVREKEAVWTGRAPHRLRPPKDAPRSRTHSQVIPHQREPKSNRIEVSVEVLGKALEYLGKLREIHLKDVHLIPSPATDLAPLRGNPLQALTLSSDRAGDLTTDAISHLMQLFSTGITTFALDGSVETSQPLTTGAAKLPAIPNPLNGPRGLKKLSLGLFADESFDSVLKGAEHLETLFVHIPHPLDHPEPDGVPAYPDPALWRALNLRALAARHAHTSRAHAEILAALPESVRTVELRFVYAARVAEVCASAEWARVKGALERARTRGLEELKCVVYAERPECWLPPWMDGRASARGRAKEGSEGDREALRAEYGAALKKAFPGMGKELVVEMVH
ncbi:uncharacterized protein BXZ73DRAFT_74738 [Epithele typhae]|uniref:uncharacterized protein n=1 Tax=Epithele typhae TaxID=378194 RepID=UPI00200890EC|nr:uncharacterized protein BXZ73DRAFT_74738 [Epithele typhae]KAH9942488.1 hypothetical protein BXZ73DRAFT_74738 [Epithele typhae]